APDAHGSGAAAASEFHRRADGELERRQTEAAEQVVGTAHEGLAVLDAEQCETWVRALTGIRTMVGIRLGIREDGDEPTEGPLAEIYQWLGELQWVLVDALEGA